MSAHRQRPCEHPPGCTYCGWCGFKQEELVRVVTEDPASKVLAQLVEVEAWIASQSSPFLSEASAHVSQAINEISLYQAIKREQRGPKC